VVVRTPESVSAHLDAAQRKLYDLIWKRAVASQMAQALYDQTSVDINAGELTFRATGSVLRFDGFVRVYLEGRDDDAEEETGAKLVRKWGRYGWFLSCSRYPDCKYRRNANQSATRAELVAEVIRPALERGAFVLCGSYLNPADLVDDLGQAVDEASA
jgi:hypothetical protein